MNRYEFAEKLCRAAGLSAELLHKIPLADAGLPAARPRDCSLNSSKIRKALNLTLTSVDAALDRLLAPKV